MFRNALLTAAAAFALVAPLTASAATIPLASDMDPNGGITEDALTGGQGRINLGDGSPGDADALYNINDDTQLFGTPIDLFPSEADFSVGSITVDGSTVAGSGVEVTPITGIDLSGLWAPDSASSDISDTGLDLWFFGLPNSFVFGALDSNDEASFVDGVLTSIDLSVTASYVSGDGGGNTVTWNGGLSIAGDSLSLSIADTQDFDTGFFGVVPSTLSMQFDGTVDAVGGFVIPDPGSLALLGFGGLLVASRRRSRLGTTV